MRDRLRASGATTTITTTISTGTTTGTPEVCCSTTSKAQTRTPHRLAPSLRPSLQASTIVRVRLVPNLSELLSSEHFLSLSLSTHTFSPYFDTIFFFQLFRWAVFITFLIQFHRMARTVSKRNKKNGHVFDLQNGSGGLKFLFSFCSFSFFWVSVLVSHIYGTDNKTKMANVKGGRRDGQKATSPATQPNRLSPLHAEYSSCSMSPLPTPPPSPPNIPPLPRDYAEFELSLQTLMRQTALLNRPLPST